MIEKTTCEDCSEVTYHIPLFAEDLSFDGETFTLHLTEKDLQDFYLLIREHALKLSEVVGA